MLIKKEELRYYDDDIQLGFYVDWSKAFRYFKKLGAPENVWTPTHIDMSQADWFILLSKRSRGKTTNLLLLGMILYQMYDSKIGYIRSNDDELKKKFIEDMFSVIQQYHYIETITDGAWNGYYYFAKKFYFAKYDEEGNRISTSARPFMICLPITMGENLKSTLNEPDIIMTIFDEFMKTRYIPDEFISYSQLLSSIRRDRWNLKVFMPSNLISPYNQYLEEMDIREVVTALGDGEHTYINAKLGARLYVEMISIVQEVSSVKMSERIKRMADKTREFFGFKNPKLKSIVGGGWQISNYAHLPRPLEHETRKLLTRDIYMEYYDKVVCLELYYSNVLGHYIQARPYYKIVRDNVVLFTLRTPSKPLEFYGIGNTQNNKIGRLIWKVYVENRFYYTSNEVGRIVEEYIQHYKDERKVLR